MHESVRSIIDEFEHDATLGDVRALHEADHPLWMLDQLATFRQWLGVPGARNTRRPSIEFLNVFLGHGRDGAVKLFREYEEAVGAREALPVLRAIGQLVRYARMHKVIAWDLDALKPDDGRGKLLVAFDSDLDTKLRNAAAAEKQTLSDFVRMAVAARVETIEKRRPRSAATV